MSERWPALLTREEAAEYLGCSIETISRLKAAEQIRSVALKGSIIRYRRTDLDHLVDNLPFADGDCPANAHRDRKYGRGRGPRNVETAQPEKQPA